MLNIGGRSTMSSEGWTPSHVKSSLSYDGVQAGRGKVHQTKPIDMVTDRFTKHMLSPDHHQRIDR